MAAARRSRALGMDVASVTFYPTLIQGSRKMTCGAVECISNPFANRGSRPFRDPRERREAPSNSGYRLRGRSLRLVPLEVDGMKYLARTFLALLVISQLAGCSHNAANFKAGLIARAEAATPTTGERPLIIAEGAGEARTWRPLTGLPVKRTLSSFTIKIDEKNGGSPGLWIGTSSIPVGAAIRLHRHLHEDEVLYIRSGIARVQVGGLQGDADAGSLVFIPRNTWVSVKNVSKKPISLLFEFNAPGFDRYMRCESVPAGEPAPPVNPSEEKRCAQLGDVEYR